MKLRHNSRLSHFRTPFGAVQVGEAVTLRLDIHKEDAAGITVVLRTWIDGEGERLYPLSREDAGVYSTTLAFEKEAIVWYSFIVRTCDGFELYVGTRPGSYGGESVTYDHPDVPSFQLTVYHHRAIRPAWYENGIVYQIFPDRFARDEHWKQRAQDEFARPHRGCERHLVEDWSATPTYDRDETGAIRSWDFYAGSLAGITEHLDYLHGLGITSIYLNPIFSAVSNHRYDTADYMSIDSLLGTEEDFKTLCAEASRRGISIILDGVFNHTGSDSIYFNCFGNYPEPGAWSAEPSIWDDAYHIQEDGTYGCWWGIDNMPALNEDSPAVRDLLFAPDGVIRHWLRAGARGWRLDVADELSDEFITTIKACACREKADALVLGEVWEDASNKISYGKLRRYLLGHELDSAMNYPFRDMVIKLLCTEDGSYSAYDASEAIETQRENYPREAQACALNLLSSHDRPRIISVLGGLPDLDSLSEAERGSWQLDDAALGLAKGRFWLATLMQMTFLGVPSLYYGDEAGLQGLSDPSNRRTYPWGNEDSDFLAMTKNAIGLRRALPLFTTGELASAALNDDVLSHTRKAHSAPDSACGDAASECATVLINRSRSQEHTVRIPFLGDAAEDLISGQELCRTDDGYAHVKLPPLGSAVAYFHPVARLQKPLERGWGVVCHITSIPNHAGRGGTLGEPARRFIDHLSQMGARYWQVLPVNPTDSFGSPYAGPSAFAGNSDLLEETEHEVDAAFETFQATQADQHPDYRAFYEKNKAWLDPWCAFWAIKHFFNGAPHRTWPHELQRYRKDLLSDPRFSQLAQKQAFIQYRFEMEWREMHAYAAARGIQIIGDIPMYVAEDSAEVWSDPALFSVDETGAPLEIAGTPPDRFSASGQVWGNPTYRWDTMRSEGYSWWILRLERSLALFDRVRLDHFLGFQSYFGIPAGQTGAAGRWLPGPGFDLFQAAFQRLGELPLIAEDLGYLTPGVRALTNRCGFPGMDVLEFADYDVREGVHGSSNRIVYTSTHDTSTLLGWTAARWPQETPDGCEQAAQATLILERALDCDAPLVMVPLQDVLGLDDDARMNRPGTTEGNWSWQACDDDVAAAAPRMAELARQHKRAFFATSE